MSEGTKMAIVKNLCEELLKSSEGVSFGSVGVDLVIHDGRIAKIEVKKSVNVIKKNPA